MFWRIMPDLDMRQEANTTQPDVFGDATTNLFAMQSVPMSWGMALTEDGSPSIHSLHENTPSQVVDEVFIDFEEAWIRLAEL